jgi:hypothetical protein
MLIRTKERAVKYWRSLLGGENEKKKKQIMLTKHGGLIKTF